MAATVEDIMTQSDPTESNREFPYRLDYYWKAIACYAIALPVYALLRGTIIENTFTLVINDPLLVLLLIIIVIACLFVLGNAFMRRSVVVGDSFITFRNRFRERTFTREDIASISIARETAINIPRAYRVIKIRLRHRRRPLRIRPSLYVNDTELIQALAQLKRELAH